MAATVKPLARTYFHIAKGPSAALTASDFQQDNSTKTDIPNGYQVSVIESFAAAMLIVRRNLPLGIEVNLKSI
jgi:hypothetical protein